MKKYKLLRAALANINGVLARYNKTPEENEELLQEALARLKEEVNKF